MTVPSTGLRRLSKFLVAATFYLIFAGGLVTSMGAGLSVPDWPLSFGKVFPEMTGGVFYEHGHRLIASGVGLCMLVLAVWLAIADRRSWVRNLGFWGLATVMAQGLLGGLTVLLMLPPPVSILHGVLAQTFFILTIVLAYSQSLERATREAVEGDEPMLLTSLAWMSLALNLVIYLQLIVAATMRHTRSGLAIHDFPLTGGALIPWFDDAMLAGINTWRDAHAFAPVSMEQVLIHFAHRVLAVVILVISFMVVRAARRERARAPLLYRAAHMVAGLTAVQIALGAWTVWSVKQPHVTSLHVVVGAGVLGASILLTLRILPVKLGRLFMAPAATAPSSATEPGSATE